MIYMIAIHRDKVAFLLVFVSTFSSTHHRNVVLLAAFPCLREQVHDHERFVELHISLFHKRRRTEYSVAFIAYINVFDAEQLHVIFEHYYLTHTYSLTNNNRYNRCVVLDHLA